MDIVIDSIHKPIYRRYSGWAEYNSPRIYKIECEEIDNERERINERRREMRREGIQRRTSAKVKEELVEVFNLIGINVKSENIKCSISVMDELIELVKFIIYVLPPFFISHGKGIIPRIIYALEHLDIKISDGDIKPSTYDNYDILFRGIVEIYVDDKVRQAKKKEKYIYDAAEKYAGKTSIY